MQVDLGVYRGEGTGGQNGEGNGIGRSGHLFGQSGEMANTNQFFNFILECFTILCGMVVVLVIMLVFSHVRIGGSGRLAWWWDEVGL